MAFPMANARITNASQPQNAFFRCLLLQRAMRAARLCDAGRGAGAPFPERSKCWGGFGCESMAVPSKGEWNVASSRIGSTVWWPTASEWSR